MITPSPPRPAHDRSGQRLAEVLDLGVDVPELPALVGLDDEGQPSVQDVRPGEVLVEHRTTSELARKVGISAASASVHAKTLRAAGLIVTRRTGKSVMHVATPLGLRLLSQG